MTAAASRSTRQAVGIGQLAVSNDPHVVLVAYGLGSCVGIAVYDASTSLAGLAHVLLPDSGGHPVDPMEPARYGDTAVASLLEAMTSAGAIGRRLTVKLAGGASVLVNPAASASGVGERNAQAIRQEFRKRGIPVAAEALGGSRGRTLELHPATGRAYIRLAASAAFEF